MIINKFLFGYWPDVQMLLDFICNQPGLGAGLIVDGSIKIIKIEENFQARSRKTSFTHSNHFYQNDKFFSFGRTPK
jgi:hypothetical protein